MPLSQPFSRDPVHTRTIVCSGFHRKDGLWDIEGHLVDVKTYDFNTQYRQVVSGEPVHQMWLRLTIDDELVIRDVEAVTDHSPFPICPAVTANFARLKGMSIRPGFNTKVRELLGGIEGCTHLVEMIGPVATTAYQTIYPYRDKLRRERGETAPSAPQPARRPRFLNTCHGWSSTGPIVKQLYPDFYDGATDASA
ncbi:MAG TPA: DUF2889 domain-containing protein [Stellaceae bacterium]|nr:DUF2889 domain-containing protein [Stellaceae bacterium]